jgi:flagellar assembly protein FliH
MATVIRSAHLTEQPRILPARPTPAAPVAPPKAPTAAMETPAPPLSPTGPARPFPSQVDAPRSIATERPPLAPAAPFGARLSPEREAELLEETRLAREQAVNEGYRDGFEHGSRTAQEALDDKRHALETLLGSAHASLHGQISGLEDVIVSLAFEALSKILGAALHDRDGVRAVVQEVIGRAKNAEPLTIRVSPSDYYLLVQDQVSLQPHNPKLAVVPDERVGMGGCLVETSGGTLDGRLETQLQLLKEALLLAKRQRPDWKEPSSAV